METTIFGVIFKLIAAACGSILSLSVLRPVNKADAFFRFIAGLIGGFTAGPLLRLRFHPDADPLTHGDVLFAYIVGSAFIAYFTLSAVSGTLSQWGTVRDIFDTLREIKAKKDGSD